MVQVRPARQSDVPRILELYEQRVISTSPAESGIAPAADDYLRVFARMAAVPGLEPVVAGEGGRVTGTPVLLVVPNLSHKGLPWAPVENVIVDEDHRRTGTGKLLMDYAVGRAKAAGCCRIGLSSDNRRDGAHRFYRSLGFEPSAQGFRMSL
jgi:GNAT superfamily N-acetyltransferase